MAKRNANRIHELRISRRWSQPELAEKVGAHWVTISKLERGHMKLTQEWMERLAQALGVEPAELISDAPLVRTVYVNGHLNDKGIVASDLEVEDSIGLAYQLQLGVDEPDKTEWYFVNSDAYYPVLSNGDLIRFTYTYPFVADSCIGKLCLVTIKDRSHAKMVGVLNNSGTPGLYDLHVVGGAPLRRVAIENLAVASLAVLGPIPILDEDGMPMP